MPGWVMSGGKCPGRQSLGAGSVRGGAAWGRAVHGGKLSGGELSGGNCPRENLPRAHLSNPVEILKDSSSVHSPVSTWVKIFCVEQNNTTCQLASHKN